MRDDLPLDKDLISKKDVLPICKQIANEHVGWTYAAERFKKKISKNNTIIISPGWSFKLSAQPHVVLINKTANKLSKQVFTEPYHSNEEWISVTRILAPDATLDTQVYQKFVHTLDEAEEYIRDFFARGLKIIDEQYNYTDEKELLEKAPFKQRRSPLEYCFRRLVLHDFDFFHKLKANDLKHYKDGSLAPIFDPEFSDTYKKYLKKWHRLLSSGKKMC